MSKRIRILPALALVALAACTNPAGPTDPLAASLGEGQEQQDPGAEDRSQVRGGPPLSAN